MLQINRDFKKQVSGKFDGMKFLLYLNDELWEVTVINMIKSYLNF